MANSTIRQADILLRECTVMQVATLDNDTGFPNIVSLTPLKSHRSLKEILFYTDR
ncbi:pyridoxamine 5'-phosphate oxidase family protein, partial [Lacticaseibacillus paracasei subsp. paracasei]